MLDAVPLLIVPVVLAIAAALATRWGLLQRRSGARVPAVLAFVAAAGSLAAALLAASVLWSDLQYGVVILPVGALLLAVVWNALLLIPAAIVASVRRRSAAQPSAEPAPQVAHPADVADDADLAPDDVVQAIWDALAADRGGAAVGLVSKRLRRETASERVPVAAERRDEVAEAIRTLPFARWQPDVPDGDRSVAVAARLVVGAGALSMNPAYVLVGWEGGDLVIAAHAREGLIPQGTALGAVQRTRAALGL